MSLLREGLDALRPFSLVVAAVCISGVLCSVAPDRAHAASTSVIYQSDFSTDPGWITDQPENFYWDSAQSALFARTYNRPDPDLWPSRHYYTETNLNPKLSFELSWDMKVLMVSHIGNQSGSAVFGLYGPKLDGFNEYITIFSGEDGAFQTRLMTIAGFPRYIWNDVTSGANFSTTTLSQNISFQFGVWYHITQRFDALSRRYHYEIARKDTGQVIYTNVIEIPDYARVGSAMKNLGISMHPDGTGQTNLAYPTRIDDYTEYMVDNVVLTQIYDETYTEPSSVLFLPGIQSSRLYRSGLLGSEDQIWEPNYNGDVSQLAMTEAGESVEQVYTRDVIDRALGVLPIYEGFANFLGAEKTAGRISDYELFAYDWRYSADDIVQNGTQYETERRYLVERVKELARNNNSHVTLVAHSNGGFLAKLLVRELEAQGLDYLIDKMILVGSPQLGTPKVIAAMLHGYDQEQFGGLLVDDETAREVIRNMPGAYGLVPSAAYFAALPEPLITFENASATQDFVAHYGESIDTLSELTDYMTDAGDLRPAAGNVSEPSDTNSAMQEAATALHAGVLDAWHAPAHIQVIEIVGVGLDTVKGLRYQQFEKQSCLSAGPGTVLCDHDVYYEPVPQLTRYGDETVVRESANAYPGDKQEYFVDLNDLADKFPERKVAHASVMNMNELQQLLNGFFQNQNVSVPFFSTTMPTFGETRDLISVHSPVAVSVRDNEGRVVGKIGEGDSAQIVNDIPGSSYIEFGGGKYIVVPSSASYEVVLAGTGVDGSYTLAIDTLAGENDPVSVAKVLATTTPSMDASLVKGGGVFGSLEVDYEGDGVIDETQKIAPEATTPELFSALRTLFGSFTKLKAKDRQWLINNVNKAEQTGTTKGYGSAGVLRIFSSIESKLVQYEAQGRVSQVEHKSAQGLMNEIITR